MIDRAHKLSVARQAKLLGFSRGSVYYSPRPVSQDDLALMRRIDELHLDYPFAGSRMLQGLLRGEGLETGRLHVATLMKKMGIEAIYRRPNTSKPAPGHKIYPYLLRKLAVTRPNQVCWGGRLPTASRCARMSSLKAQSRETVRGTDYPNWYRYVKECFPAAWRERSRATNPSQEAFAQRDGEIL
ncbi:Probable transposase, C-terminal HalF [Neorhizobium galegae bv. orientalis]|nr:Probable transposase, C-terminal HalF [Neorhizobium galegae bv. orientalis]